jgi:hypothetical protein
MSSEAPESDPKLELAMRAGMVRGAFRHFESVDLRALPILEELSMEPREVESPPGNDVLEPIRDAAHPRRLRGEPGPFVLIHEGEKHVSAHFVPGLLSCRQATVRQTALAHLSTGSAPDPWLSPASLDALREYREAVKDNASGVWVPAACRLREILEGDFLLQLAGFRQLRHTTLEEAQAAAWARILKPSVSSLLSIASDGHEVIRRPDSAEEQLKTLIDEANTPDQMVESYRTTFGHLPLRGKFSLGGALAAYIRQKGPQENLWDRLWQLAAARGDCLTTYHVCHAFITQPELIPEGHADQLWHETVSLISAPVSGGEAGDEATEWDLRGWLSRYYMRYLELHGPSLDPARLLTVSLWAADQVVSCLAGSGADRATNSLITQWIEQAIEPVAHRMELMSFFAAPNAQPSLGRLFVLHLRFPWALCLLGEMLAKVDVLPLESLSPEGRLILTTYLGVNLLLGYFAGSEDADDSVLQFHACTTKAAKAWTECCADDVPPENLRQCITTAETALSLSELATVLKRLPDLSVAEKKSAASLLRSISIAGPATLSVFWDVVSQPEWMKTSLRQFDEAGFEIFADALSELVRREGEDCRLVLPHLWAACAETFTDDQVRFRLCLWSLVASSIATGSASAMRRLLCNRQIPFLDEEVSRLRQILDSVAGDVPPEVRGWFRDVRTCLSARL